MALLKRFTESVRELHPSFAPEDAPPAALDWRDFALLLIAAVAIVVAHYHGSAWKFHHELAPRWLADGTLDLTPIEVAFFGHVYHTVSLLVAFALVPTLVAIGLGIGPRRLGLVWHRDTWRGLGVALILGVCAVPVLYFAAQTESVQAIWPGYRVVIPEGADVGVPPPGGAVHALLVAVQALSIEVLMRGLLVAGLYHRFGATSIAIGALPFTALYFGTVMPMTVLALFGGLVLGWLTLASRSIYPAVVLHAVVAFSLDAFSLAAQMQ